MSMGKAEYKVPSSPRQSPGLQQTAPLRPPDGTAIYLVSPNSHLLHKSTQFPLEHVEAYSIRMT